MNEDSAEQCNSSVTTGKVRSKRVELLLTLLLCAVLLTAYGKRASRDARYAAPLYLAVANNQLAEVDSLLAQGANPNQISFHKETVSLSNGNPVSTRSLFLDHWNKLIQEMYDRLRGNRPKSGNPEEPDVPNEPALEIAVENNSEQIVHSLLAAGADPNTSVGLDSCVLSMAARQAAPQIVCELIQKGARVNPPGGTTDLTPLQWALRRGDADLVRLLLEAGAKTDVEDEQGRTPLMQAVAIEDAALVKSLLDHGVAVNVRNKFGLTALKIARMDGQDEIVQALERAGATE